MNAIEQLDTPLFIRKTNMKLMRKGFHIHNERPIVLIATESPISTAALALFQKIGAAYFEVDMIAIGALKEEFTESDNFYHLPAVDEEELTLLVHSATFLFSSNPQITALASALAKPSVPISENLKEAAIAAFKEYLNLTRSEHGQVAICDGDTTKNVGSLL